MYALKTGAMRKLALEQGGILTGNVFRVDVSQSLEADDAGNTDSV